MISGVSGLSTSYDTSSATTAFSSDSMVSPQTDTNKLRGIEGNAKDAYASQSAIGGDKAVNTEKVLTEEEKEKLSEDQVSEMSEQLNKFMDEMNADIQFDYSKKLDRLSMKVVDRKTDEVLKEFPPENMIKVLEGIHDWIGMILDEKA